MSRDGHGNGLDPGLRNDTHYPRTLSLRCPLLTLDSLWVRWWWPVVPYPSGSKFRLRESLSLCSQQRSLWPMGSDVPRADFPSLLQALWSWNLAQWLSWTGMHPHSLECGGGMNPKQALGAISCRQKKGHWDVKIKSPWFLHSAAHRVIYDINLQWEGFGDPTNSQVKLIHFIPGPAAANKKLQTIQEQWPMIAKPGLSHGLWSVYLPWLSGRGRGQLLPLLWPSGPKGRCLSGEKTKKEGRAPAGRDRGLPFKS